MTPWGWDEGRDNSDEVIVHITRITKCLCARGNNRRRLFKGQYLPLTIYRDNTPADLSDQRMASGDAAYRQQAERVRRYQAQLPNLRGS